MQKHNLQIGITIALLFWILFVAYPGISMAVIPYVKEVTVTVIQTTEKEFKADYNFVLSFDSAKQESQYSDIKKYFSARTATFLLTPLVPKTQSCRLIWHYGKSFSTKRDAEKISAEILGAMKSILDDVFGEKVKAK